jgi:hypothetical protein
VQKTLLVVAVGLALFLGIGSSVSDKRGYVAGKYGIEIDGIMAGWLQSAEGGSATSDVVVEKLGADSLQKKHIAGVKYEDITIQLSPGDLPKRAGLAGWVAASLQTPLRKSGAVVAADYNYKEHSRRTFTNALISEVTFPALDATSKDPAYMTLKFSPETTRFAIGSGSGTPIQSPPQKKWLPANFRLQIDKIDTTRVLKIDGFTIKQQIVAGSDGTTGYRVQVPDLAVTALDPSAQSFLDWHQDFVVQGNNSDTQERSGQILFLDNDQKTVLFQLFLGQVGISGAAPEKSDASGAGRRVKFELYCERMLLQPPGGQSTP